MSAGSKRFLATRFAQRICRQLVSCVARAREALSANPCVKVAACAIPALAFGEWSSPAGSRESGMSAGYKR